MPHPNAVIPVLTYQDIAAAHDFLVVAFGFAAGSGAQIDGEPIDQPYGQREYGARDIQGHRWWFAATVAPVGQ